MLRLATIHKTVSSLCSLSRNWIISSPGCIMFIFFLEKTIVFGPSFLKIRICGDSPAFCSAFFHPNCSNVSTIQIWCSSFWNRIWCSFQIRTLPICTVESIWMVGMKKKNVSCFYGRRATDLIPISHNKKTHHAKSSNPYCNFTVYILPFLLMLPNQKFTKLFSQLVASFGS